MVIAANGLRTLARKRAFLFLMILAWMPVVVRGVQIWAAANVPGMSQMGMLAITPRTFRDFLNQQEPLVFFMTVYVGSGLIADDIRAKALQLYLSRPVTRSQYIAGQGGHPDGNARGRHLAACLAAVAARARVHGQHGFHQRQPVAHSLDLGVLGHPDHVVRISRFSRCRR